jgi:hypothetical protein
MSHGHVCSLLKVIELIDCVGGGPHYLCIVKGHAGTLWYEGMHPYGRGTPVREQLPLHIKD